MRPPLDLYRADGSVLHCEDPAAGRRVVGTPAFTRRPNEPTLTPRSAVAHGQFARSVTKGPGTYAITLLLDADTAVGLDALLDDLEDTISQYEFLAEWRPYGHIERNMCIAGRMDFAGGFEDGGIDELRLRMHRTTVRITGQHNGPPNIYR